MVNVGEEQIASLFIGDMGIKTIMVGSDEIYTRPGGYIYINLQTQTAQ